MKYHSLKRTLLFLFISQFAILTVHAQYSGGIGFFLPGIHTIHFTDLNPSLPDNVPEITSHPWITAGQGLYIRSNIMFGGEGGSIHGGKYTQGTRQLDLTGKFGYFTAGYLVYCRKGLLLYPTVSVGNNNIELYIHEIDQSGNFTSVIQNPNQSLTLHYKRSMLKFALNGAFVVAGSRSASAGGLLIGISAGYQMPYRKGTWTYDDGGITDGPDFNNSGFFFQLIIGGGGVANRKSGD